MNKLNHMLSPDIPTTDSETPIMIRSALRNPLLYFVHIKPRSEGFRFRLFMLILVIAGISTLLVNGNAKANTTIQERIAQKVLRFHVIANSDSEEDQQLKLVVKKALVESLTPQLINIDDITKVKAIISGQLDTIQRTAAQTIAQEGYDYPVEVTLENCYFPLKRYDNYTFPPGYYEALRVRIGKAEGKNWWCIMFPPLCFVDETYSIVDENSKEKLLQLLSEEEYDSLISGKVPVKVRFKLLERIKDLLE